MLSYASGEMHVYLNVVSAVKETSSSLPQSIKKCRQSRIEDARCQLEGDTESLSDLEAGLESTYTLHFGWRIICCKIVTSVCINVCVLCTHSVVSFLRPARRKI